MLKLDQLGCNNKPIFRWMRLTKAILLLNLLCSSIILAENDDYRSFLDLAVPQNSPLLEDLAYFAGKNWVENYNSMDFRGYRSFSREDVSKILKKLITKLHDESIRLNRQEQKSLITLTHEFEYELELLGVTKTDLLRLFQFMRPAWEREDKNWDVYHELSLGRTQGDAQTDVQQLMNVHANRSGFDFDLSFKGEGDRVSGTKERTLGWEGGYSGEVIERTVSYSGNIGDYASDFRIGDLNLETYGSGLSYGGLPLDGGLVQTKFDEAFSGGFFWGESEGLIPTQLMGSRFQYRKKQHLAEAYFIQQFSNGEKASTSLLGGSYLTQIKKWDVQSEVSFSSEGGAALFGKSSGFLWDSKKISLGYRYFKDYEFDFNSPSTYLGKASTDFNEHMSVFSSLEFDWDRFNVEILQDVYRDSDEEGYYFEVNTEVDLTEKVLIHLENSFDSQPEPSLFHALDVYYQFREAHAYNFRVSYERELSRRLDFELGYDQDFVNYDLKSYVVIFIDDVLNEEMGSIDLGLIKNYRDHHTFGLSSNLGYTEEHREQIIKLSVVSQF